MRKGRPLLPNELDMFKKALGDGEYVWVEGTEEDVGKVKPITEATSWSWELIRTKFKEETQRG